MNKFCLPVLITFQTPMSYWESRLDAAWFQPKAALIDTLIGYAKERFNCKYSSKIITYGKRTAVGAIMDVGQCMGISGGVLQGLRRCIPAGLDSTIDDALRQSSELRIACQEPNLKCLIDLARIAQRLPQFHAVRASAFVISQSPIDKFLPIRTIENEWTTEFPLPVLEEFGLQKICLEDAVK